MRPRRWWLADSPVTIVVLYDRIDLPAARGRGFEAEGTFGFLPADELVEALAKAIENYWTPGL